jgi:hypothetical protein
MRRTSATACLVPLVCLALAACDKDKEGSATGGGDPPAAGATAAKDPAAPAEPAEGRSPLELFTGDRPALPPPVASLRLGMPAEEARAAAPDFVGDGTFRMVALDDYTRGLEKYTKAKLGVQLSKDGERVRNLVVNVPTPFEETRAHLTAQWGEPRVGTRPGGGENLFWADTEGGVRVKANERGGGGANLVYEPVQSLETFLGDQPGRFGFEPDAPLLGMAEAELETAYGAWLTRSETDEARVDLQLPGLEITEYSPMNIIATIADGKVAEYQMAISWSLDDTARERILAALEDKFGAPKAGRLYHDYDGPPAVKVDPSRDNQMTIWVKPGKGGAERR